MSTFITIPCDTCGGKVTDTNTHIAQRRLQNASSKVYCPKCKSYGGLQRVKCGACGKEFSLRIVTAILGENFRPRICRCPQCRSKHEAENVLRCRWCGAVASHRAGDVLQGTEIGACSKAACKVQLLALISAGAARWAELTAASVGQETAGLLDPWMGLGYEALSYQKKEVLTAYENPTKSKEIG